MNEVIKKRNNTAYEINVFKNKNKTKRTEKNVTFHYTLESILVKLPCSFQEPWNVIVRFFEQ